MTVKGTIRMKTDPEFIRYFDDSILRREKLTRTCRILCLMGMFILFPAAAFIAVRDSDPDTLKGFGFILAFLVLGYGAAEGRLRHIDSIRLYRQENQETQDL